MLFFLQKNIQKVSETDTHLTPLKNFISVLQSLSLFPHFLQNQEVAFCT